MLEGQDKRKTAEIKTEDGKKERYYLYFDGETVAGKVRFPKLGLQVKSNAGVPHFQKITCSACFLLYICKERRNFVENMFSMQLLINLEKKGRTQKCCWKRILPFQ